MAFPAMKEAQTTLPPAVLGLEEKLKQRTWEIAGVCALLVTMVLLVFGQTIRHDFVNLDDGEYVYENPIVSKGLTMKGVGWAFTHVHSGNWHPLTTISHMLDCQFYGLRAGSHHLTNVALHTAAAVLLFLMLLEMTGALWRSGFVAAVFAIHPLRVESVAWVAERKDVLSGIFFMLTLWSYARYVRGQKSESLPVAEARVATSYLRPLASGAYWLTVIFFSLGLMSKPMLVTVPFVLLLLDYWPLGRLQQASQFPRLLLEKLPLFAFSALSCLATVIAQEGSIAPMESLPLSLRAGNALIAYAVYLGKLIYPVGLAVLYPMLKNGWPAWQVIAAITLLVAMTTWAFLSRRKKPYLVVGWLWYLGMLIPVIGILQVGQQAYADRYTYLPQIGLYFAGTWALADWAGEWPHRRVILRGMGVMVLCVMLVAAYHQTSYWSDSITLWTHTLGCTEDNSPAHYNLGIVRIKQGQTEEAIAQYRESLRINPAYVEAHNNLGNLLFQQGQNEEAIDHFNEALQIKRVYPEAHYNLGNVLLRQGRVEEAVAQYRESLRIDHPASADAHNNLGVGLLRQGHIAEAIIHNEKALELRPDSVLFRNNLAWILATAPEASLRNGARAVQLATQASQSNDGNDPAILRTLAAAYANVGEFHNAVQTAQHALQLAETQSNTVLASKLRREIKLYEAGQPFQEGQ
jgi:tetratricopeptide (TPR) repeat protein